MAHRPAPPPLVLPLLRSADCGAALERVLDRDGPALARRLQRWGRFARPVQLHVVETPAELRAAAPMPSVLDLRGLAWGDRVWLLRPERWPEPPADVHLARLLAHECAHVLWFQRATGPDRPCAYVPTWFREGFAVVASEGAPRAQHRRGMIDVDLEGAAYADDVGMADLGSAVYDVAAHAFAAWHAQFGARALAGVARAMRAGNGFAASFAAVCAVDDKTFVRQWAEAVAGEVAAR